MLLLSVLLTVLFLYIWFQDIQRAWRMRDAFWQSNVAKFTVRALLTIGISVLVVNTVLPQANSLALRYAFSIGLSAAISFTWYAYLRWIDFFEPERHRYLLLTFALSCVTIWAVFPLSGIFQALGFRLDGTPLNDFLYSTIVIGMVEEWVKVLPLLLMLRFSKQIDEPLDYIIYASASALGFAFIENILYLENTHLAAVGARLLYASVAHMFFAACIAYPLALYRIKTGKTFHVLVFIGGFIAAALAHGFYDFWLITRQWQFPLITTVFFLGTLHVFTLMKNNLINLSSFYDYALRLNRSKLKYDLIWFLLVVIYAGYIGFGVLHGRKAANTLLVQSAITHVAVVIYLAFTFSSFNILKQHRFPLRFPFKFFLPKLDAYPDYTGLTLHVVLPVHHLKNKLSGSTEAYNGTLVKRVVLEDDMNWYVFLTEQGNAYLLRPKDFSVPFTAALNKHVLLCALKQKHGINRNKLVYRKAELEKGRLGLAGII